MLVGCVRNLKTSIKCTSYESHSSILQITVRLQTHIQRSINPSKFNDYKNSNETVLQLICLSTNRYVYLCKICTMSKRDEIIQLADTLIRQKGYNAFSFYDISDKVGIKTASIHYHFPAKSDLGEAVIQHHIENLNRVIEHYKRKSPTEKLDKFFAIYANIKKENKVCLVGSLATDFNTLDEKVQQKLKAFSEEMLHWVSHFLEDGRKENLFVFDGESRIKALMIISNMLAIVQLTRLTNDNDFEAVKNSIKNELLKK